MNMDDSYQLHRHFVRQQPKACKKLIETFESVLLYLIYLTPTNHLQSMTPSLD